MNEGRSGNPFCLMSVEMLERLPSIQRLEGEFSSLLPARFNRPRLLVPPTDHPELLPVLRADCGNTGCRVRALVHLDRRPTGWQFLEQAPLIDRTGTMCEACRAQFSRLVNRQDVG